MKMTQRRSDTAAAQQRAGCVIAAAGLSSRMGALKPLLPLGKETVLRMGILTMLRSGVSPVVVVTGREHEAVEKSIEDLDCETVFNPDYASCQMLDSVALGLNRIRNRCARVLFAPADSPLYSEETVRKLICSDEKICAPYHNGKFGHPVCFDAALIPEILVWSGSGGLSGALDHLGGKTPIACDDPGAYLDADTPQDYEALKQIFENAGV